MSSHIGQGEYIVSLTNQKGETRITKIEAQNREKAREKAVAKYQGFKVERIRRA